MEGAPSLYAGETSRSMYERRGEHWGGVRSRSNNNHMIKHTNLKHDGEQPKFVIKVVKFFRPPLARQVAKAVRTRRRGGEREILNSRGECACCCIPHLRVD